MGDLGGAVVEYGGIMAHLAAFLQQVWYPVLACANAWIDPVILDAHLVPWFSMRALVCAAVDA